MNIKYVNTYPSVSTRNALFHTFKALLSENSFENYQLLGIFILALTIRLLFWKFFGTLFNAMNGDTIEYYISSINFEPHILYKTMWSYEHWYQRTPIYVLFLHLIQRQLIIQVILSSLGCVLMFKLNKVAGILWTIYLQDIIYSFNYNKECVLLFTVILTIYLFRNRKVYLYIFLPMILAGFVSYGGVVTSTHTYTHGFMWNFWNLWQPSFNITVGYSKIFIYLQALPYVLAMAYFIRNVKLISVESFICILLSILYTSLYAEPRYREMFMPLLFLFISKPLGIYVRKINIQNIVTYFKHMYDKIKNESYLTSPRRNLKPVSMSILIVLFKSFISKI